MTDIKRNYFSDFYATNWNNNSGFTVPDSIYTPNFSVFNGYFNDIKCDNNWFNFDSFNNFCLPALPFNNFNFGLGFNLPTLNFANWNLQMPSFDFGFSSQFAPQADCDSFFKTPSLKKPSALGKSGTYTHIPLTKSGKTLKAIGNNGRWVDSSVHEATIEGTKVYTFSYTNLGGLRPDLKHAVAELSKLAEQHGYTLVVSDGYRSIAEQAAAKKRKPNLVATPGYSPHNYGCAIDVALYENGSDKPTNITQLSWFHSYAKNTLGLDWGHDWSSKDEPWHFERKGWNKAGSDAHQEYCQVTGKKSNSA